MNDRKEVRRENKQVRSLKRLRTMQSKSKTGTKRFNRLKEKVYNPFLDKSPLNLKGDPIPKYNPTEGVKKGVKIAKKVAKKAVKVAGSKALGVLGFMGAGTLSATAGNKNAKKSEGEQIKNLLTKHKLKGGR